MIDIVLVYVVCTSFEEANTIAKTLVDKKLAACVNVFPEIQSFYHWEGNVQNSKEVVFFAKTQVVQFEKLKETVLHMHSYECPCIIALPIVEGHENYLKWIANEVK